jgi:hypothetical protein
MNDLESKPQASVTNGFLSAHHATQNSPSGGFVSRVSKFEMSLSETKKRREN